MLLLPRLQPSKEPRRRNRIDELPEMRQARAVLVVSQQDDVLTFMWPNGAAVHGGSDVECCCQSYRRP